MAKNPDRPKIKYKHVKAPKPPLMTKEEIKATNLARLEAKHKINPTLVADMLRRKHGLVSHAAQALKVPHATLQRYVEKHAECIDARAHARDAMGDKAENKLFDKIEEGDLRAILYYLSTVHRGRGYGPAAQDAADNNTGRGPVFVETVNIIGVPSGTFLPKEAPAADNLVIEN